MAGVKMKLALGLNTCLYVSESSDDVESMKSSSRSCSDSRRRMPITPTPSSSGLRVLKYSDKSTSEFEIRFRCVDELVKELVSYYVIRTERE
ncbi:hypothetical protein HanHA300_Chr03g0075961 [Helianthus annuus]|nr:hypothetical protein HanHA300_Chr03g0075961 [Helianthus annuus]KAJ0766656.1 hypothetical protein HanLR1_Chr03g0080031 [Helianthus annuus]KAJ0772558.1 hypothetical protein HanOQP8_Chr03g0088721 [Helianthus annuus]